MSNLVKLEFAQLDLTGKNYVPWSVDVKNHLTAKSLLETLDDNNESSASDKATALIFIRRHIDESLKNEHLTVDNPSELWKSLKNRYDHQRDVLLPKYLHAWNTLRFQDYKKVSEYNSVMYSIVSYLKYCGTTITEATMIEKTLSTFHASSITLSQQYRIRGFTSYSDLLTALLLAEEYNVLLMKNHQSRPTGSKAPVESNFVNSNKTQPTNNFRGRGRGRQGPGRRFNQGRGSNQGRGQGGTNNAPQRTNNPHHKRNNDDKNHDDNNKRAKESNSSKASGSGSRCYKCGMKGHWHQQCRTNEHFVKLYEAFKENNGKGKEVNFVDLPLNEFTHLEPSDFHNDLGNVNEINYVENDLIGEYSHLEEPDFTVDQIGNSATSGAGGI